MTRQNCRLLSPCPWCRLLLINDGWSLVTLGDPLPFLTTLPVEFHFPLIRLYIRPVTWPSLSLFQLLSSVGVVRSLITVSSTGVLAVKVLTFSKIESMIFNMFITLFFVGKVIVFIFIFQIHYIVKNSNLFISYILTVIKLVLR